MPVDCPEIKCCDPNLFGYILANAPTYSNTEQSFILECPPGYDCEPGEYPREVIVPPGLITLPCFGNPVECQEMVDEIAIEEIMDQEFPGSTPNPEPVEALFVNTFTTDVQTCDPPAAESPLTVNVPLHSTFAELAALAAAMPKGNPVTVNVPAGQTRSKISTAHANAEAQFIAQTIALARQECLDPGVYPPGAYAFWTFDNIITDVTGNGRDFTNVPPTSFRAGKVNTGIHVESNGDGGVGTGGLQANNVNFAFTGAADSVFTFVGWFKLNAGGFFDGIFIRWNWYDIRPRASDKKIEFVGMDDGTFGGGDVTTVTNTVATDNTWRFIVLHYNGITNDGFIEVDRVDRATFSNLSVASANLFMRIGSTFDKVNSLDVDAEECGFWTRLLTEPELDYLWNSGNGRAYNT